MIEGNGRLTLIGVQGGYFFYVLDRALNVHDMQQTRFEGMDKDGHILFVRHGSKLYPRD